MVHAVDDANDRRAPAHRCPRWSPCRSSPRQRGRRRRSPSRHERYQLANGLDVILHQDRSIPIVHVNVTYHVGSGNERPGQSGYAHLFEHMMFQGSNHVGWDKHFVVLRDIGARGVNGTTNTDRTNYFESVPSHQLETALWLESDRMGYLLLDQKALDTQREVVRNERRVELRERRLQPGTVRRRPGAVPRGPPLPLPDHRPARGSAAGHAGRRPHVLRPLVRAGERHPGAGRGLRHPDGARAGRQVVRHVPGQQQAEA